MFPFLFLFFFVEAIFFFFNQEKLVADIILPVLFLHKIPELFFKAQEKATNHTAVWQTNAAMETHPFPGYWVRIQAGICGLTEKYTVCIKALGMLPPHFRNNNSYKKTAR